MSARPSLDIVLLLALCQPRKPRKYATAPQVDTTAMTDEEFYAWLDNELDTDLTLDEIQSDDSGIRSRGEI